MFSSYFNNGKMKSFLFILNMAHLFPFGKKITTKIKRNNIY